MEDGIGEEGLHRKLVGRPVNAQHQIVNAGRQVLLVCHRHIARRHARGHLNRVHIAGRWIEVQDCILARPGAEQVRIIAVIAVHRVVARAAIKRVRPRTAVQRVCAARAGQRLRQVVFDRCDVPDRAVVERHLFDLMGGVEEEGLHGELIR